MKKLLLIGLLLSTPVYADIVCDDTKTVDGKSICVINVPLEIPQSVIDAGGIESYAMSQGWNPTILDPNCTPSQAVTCPPCTPQSAVSCTLEEIQAGCEPRDAVECPPCTPVEAVVCGTVANPVTALEYAKLIIKKKVKEEYMTIAKQQVARQAAAQAEATLKSLFPTE